MNHRFYLYLFALFVFIIVMDSVTSSSSSLSRDKIKRIKHLNQFKNVNSKRIVWQPSELKKSIFHLYEILENSLSYHNSFDKKQALLNNQKQQCASHSKRLENDKFLQCKLMNDNNKSNSNKRSNIYQLTGERKYEEKQFCICTYDYDCDEFEQLYFRTLPEYNTEKVLGDNKLLIKINSYCERNMKYLTKVNWSCDFQNTTTTFDDYNEVHCECLHKKTCEYQKVIDLSIM
jgi:hypothetical protein